MSHAREASVSLIFKVYLTQLHIMHDVGSSASGLLLT